MRFWRPEPNAQHLLDWWSPLVKAARRALDDEVPWLIVLDEWHFEGRVQRKGRPDIWVYVHRSSRESLSVDQTGQPYRFIYNRSGSSLGRYKEIDIRSAVHRAGLPHATKAVRYEVPALSGIEDWDEAELHHQEPGCAPTLRLVR